jgi:hypothetical protein
MNERIEFDAHKVVNKATKVAFRTKAGEKVLFTAEKPTKVPVRVLIQGQRELSIGRYAQGS